MNRQWGLAIFCAVMLLAAATYALPNETEELTVIGQESAPSCIVPVEVVSGASERPSSPDRLEIGGWAQHIGIFRGANWYLDADSSRSWNAANDVCTPFGLSTDTPIPRYWIGTFRNGNWYLDQNQNGRWDGSVTDRVFTFGQAGDKPIDGVLNGGSSVYFGVFRSGWWYIDWNGNKVWDGAAVDAKWAFGLAGDLPVVADWSNSGTDRIGTFRNGKWYVDWNGNHKWDGPVTDRVFTFGQAGDIPVTGDWSNSGVERIGIFRNGKWYVDWNGNNAWDGSVTDRIWTFGQAGDKPHTRHYSLQPAVSPAGIATEIFNQVNAKRMANSVPALTRASAIDSIVQSHANYMATNHAQSHDYFKPYSTPGTRCYQMNALGYGSPWGENVAQGRAGTYSTCDSPAITIPNTNYGIANYQVTGWFDYDSCSGWGHRTNILNSSYVYTGVACALGSDGWYYCGQDFSGP